MTHEEHNDYLEKKHKESPFDSKYNRYIIVDWANNRCFRDNRYRGGYREFNSFFEAWDYIYRISYKICGDDNDKRDDWEGEFYVYLESDWLNNENKGVYEY